MHLPACQSQTDQGNDLTVSARHVLDEILDELRSWNNELYRIFSMYVPSFPFGTAQQDQNKVQDTNLLFLHVLVNTWTNFRLNSMNFLELQTVSILKSPLFQLVSKSHCKVTVHWLTSLTCGQQYLDSFLCVMNNEMENQNFPQIKVLCKYATRLSWKPWQNSFQGWFVWVTHHFAAGVHLIAILQKVNFYPDY